MSGSGSDEGAGVVGNNGNNGSTCRSWVRLDVTPKLNEAHEKHTSGKNDHTGGKNKTQKSWKLLLLFREIIHVVNKLLTCLKMHSLGLGH